MKTVTMTRDFNFRAEPRTFIAFKDGETYTRVTEAAAEAIVKAKAGFIKQAKKSDDE